ncbi:hypothetical protein [Armatimonas sp.]|uniref:hypothetical protein n=1 Tax=Armatimonas sp. TaxID=1872638 RepID=UPI00374D9235
MPAHRKPTQLQTTLIGTDREEVLRSFCQATDVLRRAALRHSDPTMLGTHVPDYRRER